MLRLRARQAFRAAVGSLTARSRPFEAYVARRTDAGSPFRSRQMGNPGEEPQAQSPPVRRLRRRWRQPQKAFWQRQSGDAHDLQQPHENAERDEAPARADRGARQQLHALPIMVDLRRSIPTSSAPPRSFHRPMGESRAASILLYQRALRRATSQRKRRRRKSPAHSRSRAVRMNVRVG